MKRRKLWFRCAAILLGLSLVAALEAGLRLTDLGQQPIEDNDPFVGFNEVRPLFRLNSDNQRFEVASDRLKFFRPDSFAAVKPENGGRIFCLGGSTVQGRPYSTETSFSTWLKLSLMSAEPERDWEVVNCGGVSYASYRLVSILEEVLQHQPDAIVLYTGHNEFLEERTYEGIKHRPPWMEELLGTVYRLRIYGVARQLSGKDTNKEIKRTELNTEVEALLDYRGGMEKYQRDDDWRAGVVRHYEYNLRRMIQLAADAQIPLIVVNPVSDLRDTPPFKSEFAPDLKEEQKQKIDKLWMAAKESDWNNLNHKLTAAQEVTKADPGFADAHFLSARVLERLERPDDAESAYCRAKDADVCPLRMLESMHVTLKSVAKQTNTPLVDARKLFATRAENGIPGNRQLIDHIHPRITGHQLIAEALFEQLAKLGLTAPHKRSDTRDKLFQDNLSRLDNAYFLQGEERLRGLRGWAAGRSEKMKLGETR